MSVKQKYLKDENGEVFSPITSESSIYTSSGNDMSIQAITIAAANDGTLTLGAAWAKVDIPLSSTLTQIGTNLSRSGNYIKIGAGIKYVEVSGNLGMWSTPDIQEAVLTITLVRNGSEIRTASADTSKHTEVGLLALSVSPIIWQVQSGDVIKAKFSSASSGAHRFIGRNANTYLTVKKIG